MKNLSTRLDHLAELVAGVTEQDERRPLLAAAVADLESAVGDELGGIDDPVVTLWRRFARAHRLLLHSAATPESVGRRVERHARALAEPWHAEPWLAEPWQVEPWQVEPWQVEPWHVDDREPDRRPALFPTGAVGPQGAPPRLG